MRRSYLLLSSIVALPFTSACKKEAPPDPSAGASPSAVVVVSPTEPAGNSGADADEYFATKCRVCHGEGGKGDGPGAAALDPKPRDFTDAAWQGAVTDDHIRKVILSGGAAIGKSPIMPGNPDLKNKPEVVDALVKKVRTFQ